MTTGPLPRMTPKAIGDIRVHSLVDHVGPTRLAAELFGPDADDLIRRHPGLLGADYVDPQTGRMILAYQSFLIATPEATVLVDAAVGEDGEYPARPDWHRRKSDWLNHLGRAGFAPEDIDIVFLTHLHVDHVGWLSRRQADVWVPTFPRARHVVTAAELDYWRSHHADFPWMARSYPDSIEIVERAGLFETIEGGAALTETLRTVDLSGHSIGMIGLEVAGPDGPVAAFNADLMHHPIQNIDTSLTTPFCHDKPATVAVRRRKLAEYAKAGTMVFCGHFPGDSAGRFEPLQGGDYAFVPLRD